MTEYNINVVVWAYKEKKQWFRDLVSKAIVFFTGMEYTHVGVTLGGHLYESTVWYNEKGKFVHGARKVKDLPSNPDFVFYPEGITSEQVTQIQNWMEDQITEESPYNFFKLVMFAIVYPTRWFWNLIRWVPFSHELFGHVCSAFVDTAFKQADYDIFPMMSEEVSVPGDYVYLRSKLRVLTDTQNKAK